MTATDLIFAATERCPCGAGLAMPKRGPRRIVWRCSAVLLRTHDPEQEHAEPVSYDGGGIAHEGHPIQNKTGATTRPAP